MITFKTKTAEGRGWTKTWHDIYRNGADTGFTAFEQNDKTLSVERDDRHYGNFATLDQVTAWVAKQPLGFGEKLSAKGII